MRFLLGATCFLALFSCKQKFDNKTYEENKISLAQREREHPQQFLKLSSRDKKNLFGATVIKGRIKNTASVAVYENTRIKILCYANRIRVEEHEDIMPDPIKPGSEMDFKVRYRLPKGTDSLALSVMSADTISDSVASLKK